MRKIFGRMQYSTVLQLTFQSTKTLRYILLYLYFCLFNGRPINRNRKLLKTLWFLQVVLVKIFIQINTPVNFSSKYPKISFNYHITYPLHNTCRLYFHYKLNFFHTWNKEKYIINYYTRIHVIQRLNYFINSLIDENNNNKILRYDNKFNEDLWTVLHINRKWHLYEHAEYKIQHYF